MLHHSGMTMLLKRYSKTLPSSMNSRCSVIRFNPMLLLGHSSNHSMTVSSPQRSFTSTRSSMTTASPRLSSVGNYYHTTRITMLPRSILVRHLSLPPSSSDNKDPNSDNPNPRNRNRLLASIGISAVFLMSKAKVVLVALQLTKALPLVSMLITSFTYSLFFGWPYAVGMVGLIFTHECGHALVMRHYKVPFSPMVFIPFMGAVIVMNKEAHDVYQEAMIALGGPALGSATALAVGMSGVAMDSQLLIALADFGYMVNLFNLMPIGSLDGGRIGEAISPYFGVAGLLGGGALIYMDAIHNPIFYLIMLSGLYSTTMRFTEWDSSKHSRDYYNIPRGKQLAILGAYMSLICGLILAMKENNKYRKTPKQLRDPDSSDRNINPFQAEALYDDYFGEESM